MRTTGLRCRAANAACTRTGHSSLCIGASLAAARYREANRINMSYSLAGRCARPKVLQKVRFGQADQTIKLNRSASAEQRSLEHLHNEPRLPLGTRAAANISNVRQGIELEQLPCRRTASFLSKH